MREILGNRDEPRFAGREVERLPVAWHEATKRRLRRATDAGTDVAVDLPRGAFLADGAVLADDGHRVIVAERTPEEALVVRLTEGQATEQAVHLGHAFGNQHVPVEVEGSEVRVPLTTSEEVARATVDALDLDGAQVDVELVALGSHAPLAAGHSHGTDEGASADLLPALQLGDSALPIGRFVHSHGLEAWLDSRPGATEADLRELVQATIAESVGPLDATVLAHAHGAPDPDRLEELDAVLTAHKISAPARAASRGCGRRLAALATELTTHPLVDRLAERIRAGRTDGNLAVVEGALARALGITRRHAVLLELRGAAAGLLSAAVRLGRLAPMRAQAILLALGPVLERTADDALAADLTNLRSGAFELEIHAIAHRRAQTRFFST